MKIIIIVAMTSDRLIGRDGRLPWQDPNDLRHFKQTTSGHAVIMGRKTFDSIGKALPNRRNIVVSRNHSFAAPPGQPVDVVHSFEDAIALCRERNETKSFIVGGAEIYKLALPLADEVLITTIDRRGLTGDTYFPEWNPSEWEAEPIESLLPLRVTRWRRRR